MPYQMVPGSRFPKCLFLSSHPAVIMTVPKDLVWYSGHSRLEQFLEWRGRLFKFCLAALPSGWSSMLVSLSTVTIMRKTVFVNFLRSIWDTLEFGTNADDRDCAGANAGQTIVRANSDTKTISLRIHFSPSGKIPKPRVHRRDSHRFCAEQRRPVPPSWE